VASIYRLGHLADFVRRAAALNEGHNADDAVRTYLAMEPEAFRALVEAAGPEPQGDLGAAVRARKALATIHKEFPLGNPVHEQAAYLLRAFAGLQPFAAGSDLTGWDLLAETLEHHGFDLLAESEDGRALCGDLWRRLQATHPDGLKRNQVLDRDEAWAWLAAYFRPRIMSSGVKADVPERRP
jgi:hypothetical protein